MITTQTVVPKVGNYASVDGATSWSGSTVLPVSLGSRAFDPAVTVFLGDTLGYVYIHGDSGQTTYGNWYFSRSSDTGQTWSTPKYISGKFFDKPHMVSDQNPSSQYKNRIYTICNDVGASGADGNELMFSYSPDLGQNFTTPVKVSGSTGVFNAYAGNIAVGPAGQVYLAWTIQDSTHRDSVLIEGEWIPCRWGVYEGIGFRASLDGGQSFADSARKIMPIRGYFFPSTCPQPGRAAPRAFTYPVLAVDKYSCDLNGRIYLVWSDSALSSDWDVRISHSDDHGTSWSTPVRVNDDELGNGCDQFMPWVTVDPYGSVHVIFYDTRSDPGNRWMQVYCATSADGGNSFVNRRVSDARFQKCAGTFFGDYTSISSDSNFVYPLWMEHRSDEVCPYEMRVAKIPLVDTLTGSISASKRTRGRVVLSGNVTIPSGVTLTVSPNCKVVSIAGLTTKLIVQGTLKLEGTQSCIPTFTSTVTTAGSWSGINIQNSGSIESGQGAIVEYATVGVTIDSVLAPDTLSGFRIRTSDVAGIITYSDSVRIISDTISDVPSGYGLMLDHADPFVKSVHISDCQYGIYAVASKSRIRDSRIVGPGYYGFYSAQDAEFPGDHDTLYVTSVSDSGYFTGAHMYAGYKAHAIVDSCRFVTDTTPGVRSPYGVKAGQSVYVKLRRSLIKGFGTAGFHSFKSKANLGKTKYNNAGSEDPGDNSVHAVPVWLYDEELGWWSIDPKRVMHTGNTSTDTMRAENNWWGSSSPPSSWFTPLVDYNPFLTTDPGLGKIAPSAAASESQSLPRDFTLGQNYPNPFNGTTVIEYEIHATGKVRLAVYNVLGQLVRSLIDEAQSAGRHRAEWNGRDEHGRELASGVYFYRMQSDRQVNSRKMVLLK